MKPPKKINDQKCIFPANLEYLAKTVSFHSGEKEKGIDVLTHCKIVGLVARELVNRQPIWLRDALFPKGSELIAASHDIGKISPGFQEKIYSAIGKPLGLVSPELDRKIGGHPAVSQATLSDTGHFIPEIVGRHHGYSSQNIGQPNDDNFGGTCFQKIRLATINKLKEIFHADWPRVLSDIDADILAGLTTVADWIGSGFNFSSSDIKNCDDTILNKLVTEALDAAGFIRPNFNKGLSFNDCFRSYEPYPIQKKFIEEIKGPGVYILEAPMGLGKTEAALFAAYKVLENQKATGIYFALPTQLTSDKMHSRMNDFLGKIINTDFSQQKALLLHSAAWLKQTEMGEDGQPGRSWFDYSKRGLLAPFAVGTIDQALMAVMNVKHGFVRTFGLAGKVVILDEVHSYDSYTGTILDSLVKALNEIHCTVIILSATLSIERRAAFLQNDNKAGSVTEASYPLISAYPRKGELICYPAPGLEEPEININILSDDNPAIEEALSRAEQGQQVLWLENTIDEAQNHYKIFGARTAGTGIECGLIHSRFLKKDRITNETRWVELFGKQGKSQRNLFGRILVGTQVLEQSLDIDGDFMVTRICPTDMLLQRTGRLWRHRETDSLRPINAKREVWILAPNLDVSKKDKSVFGNSAYVYAPYVLCRSLEVWKKEKLIKLTGGKIRSLIEATYSDRDEEGQMAQYKKEVEDTRDKLSRLARHGISRGGKTLPESKAATRYSERDDVDVLLIQKKHNLDDGVQVTLLNGNTLLLPKTVKLRGGKEWRKIAAEIQQNTVKVAERIAPKFVKSELEFLKHFVYLGDEYESPFRLAIVKESGELIGVGHQNVSDDFSLYYDPVIGYISKKF
ncbi:MAG: CRISPR-associated helicase Cas3' [Clostridiaceae bacterium]|nr:CRISPR-associated helicase Cas3' [Clostridiaceae bacterium]